MATKTMSFNLTKCQEREGQRQQLASLVLPFRPFIQKLQHAEKKDKNKNVVLTEKFDFQSYIHEFGNW